MPKIDDTDTTKQPKSSDTMSDEALERAVAEYYSNDALAVVLPIRGDLVYGDGWKAGLRCGKDGVTRDPGNAVIILANDPAWRGLRFDEFTGREECSRVPTLTGMSAPTTPEGLETYVCHWLVMSYRQSWSLEAVRAAIHYTARLRPYHSVRDYLNGLEWDGVERISTWLTEYLGAEDSPTNRAIGRMWLISAVARAYVPGSKADHMLVLEGDQGARKTTALEALCSPAWFQPELGDLRNKDSQLTLRGKWVVCMDELHALRSADVTELAKNYLTRTVDKYRPPYGRHEVEQPRSCVFAGTTNADAYLTDPTGNRRFWPVKVATEKPVDVGLIRTDRNQLWAEAKEAYLQGEHWWPNRDQQALLRAATDERTQGDTWEDIVAHSIRGLEWTTVAMCLDALKIEPKDQKQAEQTRIAKLLLKLGWKRYRHREADKLVWRYKNQEQP